MLAAVSWTCCAQVLKHEHETKITFPEVVEYLKTQNEVVKAFEEELGSKLTSFSCQDA
jgi:hypothetical protein